MTNEECRTEALKRVKESDRLFGNLAIECARRNQSEEQIHRQVSHLRQTAAVYASLAGPIDD